MKNCLVVYVLINLPMHIISGMFAPQPLQTLYPLTQMAVEHIGRAFVDKEMEEVNQRQVEFGFEHGNSE